MTYHSILSMLTYPNHRIIYQINERGWFVISKRSYEMTQYYRLVAVR